MRVLIVDYGMGNLGSVSRAFEECGASVVVSDEPASVRDTDRIVIPGVGSFAEAMRRIHSMGWYKSLREAVLVNRIPILGICLGMQLFAESGEEGGFCCGLDLIRGRVSQLDNTGGGRLPHVGWNEVHPVTGCLLFKGIKPKTDFYFVHSYQLVPQERGNVIAITPYCGEFTSAIQDGNVFGVQFHPEKSSKAGFQLIRNFLEL